jgi:hypothetical protein
LPYIQDIYNVVTSTEAMYVLPDDIQVYGVFNRGKRTRRLRVLSFFVNSNGERTLNCRAEFKTSDNKREYNAREYPLQLVDLLELEASDNFVLPNVIPMEATILVDTSPEGESIVEDIIEEPVDWDEIDWESLEEMDPEELDDFDLHELEFEIDEVEGVLSHYREISSE